MTIVVVAVVARLLVPDRYEVLLRRAEADLAGAATAPNGANASDGRAFNVDAVIVRTATSAERRRLLALRADGIIGDAAFQRVEQELDWEELELQQLAPRDGSGQAS